MKYGIREICDVVFKAKSKITIGSKTFYKGEPVLIFDTLKTSTLEGATTTVYAQGGKGNARLMGWDGERTVTFTMEDALISTESLAVLTGAGVVDVTSETTGHKIAEHRLEITELDSDKEDGTLKDTITLKEPVTDITNLQTIYVMKADSHGNPISEPYIYKKATNHSASLVIEPNEQIDMEPDIEADGNPYVIVDYYTDRANGTHFNITPDAWSENFYIEGSTLFRDQDGKDQPAQFTIPSGKVQTNFTFTMASTGDPSTFTFTVDAFPDYLDHYPDGNRVKVFSSIQVFNDGPAQTAGAADKRRQTDANPGYGKDQTGTTPDEDDTGE